MPKPRVVIIGKLPPPFIGPAIATNIILNSSIAKDFDLIHVNTTINKSIDSFGKAGWRKILANLRVYLLFYRALKEQDVDFVHLPISQTTIGFLKDSVFILIANRLNTKVLIQLRGGNFKNWIAGTSNIFQKYLRFCLSKTVGVIVLGENLRHLFEEYFKHDQIHVVPNGCNISIPKHKNPSENKTVRLLYFSNLLESKGIKELLEATKILRDRGVDNFELNAVGAWYDQQFKDTCMSFATKEHLPVTFHPPKHGAEKWAYFASADIFVFTPNMPEGHPWSIIEAMAAGLPIISTDQGAIVESVIHGENGFIVPIASPVDIAAKLEELISDKLLRQRMEANSLAYYRSRFTEKCMTDNLSRTYNSILE